MVLRQLGGDAAERAKFVHESVKKAKEALQQDVKDGTSWCESSTLSSTLHLSDIYLICAAALYIVFRNLRCRFDWPYDIYMSILGL